MTKLAGALVLVACGVMTGWSRVAEQKRLWALCRDMSAALGFIAEEIGGFSAPLPGIFSHLGSDGPEQTRTFFGALASAMELESLDRAWIRLTEALPLSASERLSLGSLSMCLGRSEGGSQTRELCRVRDMLSASAEERRVRLANQSRCSIGVSVSAAAMLAVILL